MLILQGLCCSVQPSLCVINTLNPILPNIHELLYYEHEMEATQRLLVIKHRRLNHQLSGMEPKESIGSSSSVISQGVLLGDT